MYCTDPGNSLNMSNTMLNYQYMYLTSIVLNLKETEPLTHDGIQERSQGEAKKPGLQHHMGLDARNSDVVACKQQMRRPACASVRSDRHLCYSKVTRSDIILHFLMGFNMIQSLATPLGSIKTNSQWQNRRHSRDTRFPIMRHFDTCRLRQAYAATC